jgi:hypothetical protein
VIVAWKGTRACIVSSRTETWPEAHAESTPRELTNMRAHKLAHLVDAISVGRDVVLNVARGVANVKDVVSHLLDVWLGLREECNLVVEVVLLRVV